jgi:hypothetical protein
MGRVRRIALAAVIAAAVTGALGTPRPASAQPRVVIDQVTLEPSPLYGQARLRVFASAIDLLSGNVVPIDGAKAWTLEVSGSDRRLPYLVSTYDGGQYLTAVAVVVETTAEYANDLAVVQTVLDEEFLSKLPALTAQAVVFGYADKPTATPKFAAAKSATQKLAGLSAATDPTEPALLDAIERAVSALKKYKTDPEGQPVRKLVVVVSDGRDKVDDRVRVTALGKRAAKEGIRIHALAYSPTDTRRPMLVLGELAKRSFGTFRWVHKIGDAPIEPSFREQVKNLLVEIDRQYVLTYFVPADDVAGKKISVTADLRGKPLPSNAVKAPLEATCGGVVCAGTDAYCVNARCVARGGTGGRGVLGWILLIGGIVVGAIVVLGLIGFVLTKRKEAQVRRAAALLANPPGAPAHASAPPAAGLGADGRIQGVAAPSHISSAPPGGGYAQPAYGSAPPQAQAQQPVQRIQAIGEGQSTAGHHGGASAAATLYVMGGPRAGQRLALRHGFMIGKDRGCDLQIEDGYTSAHHAVILMDAHGNCSLQDRGSTNGTFVNGVRIHEPVPLHHGVTIRIGSTDLRFLAQ